MDDVQIHNNADLEGGGDIVLITNAQENAVKKELEDENIERIEIKHKAELPADGKIKIMGAITIENTGKGEFKGGAQPTAQQQQQNEEEKDGKNEIESKSQKTRRRFSFLAIVPAYAGTEGIEISSESRPQAREMIKRRKMFILRISLLVLLAFLITYSITILILLMPDLRLMIAYSSEIYINSCKVAYIIVALTLFFCHKLLRGKTGQIIAVIPLAILCGLCSFIYPKTASRSSLCSTGSAVFFVSVDVCAVILGAIFIQVDWTKRNRNLAVSCCGSLIFVICCITKFLIMAQFLQCLLRDLLLFVLFNLYLCQHLQMIIGAKTYKIYTENYIPAASLIYVDVTIIFYSLIEYCAPYCHPR